ncbi:MAG: hypothetical protein JNK61_08270 [Bacteroidia bacterium]|nr:hypothetical protein [Bacteroidia bacterium]HQU99909.1 hypothetical protein [Bacteroidia bacterium]
MTVKAQQRIKGSFNTVTMLVIPINPSDSVFLRTLKNTGYMAGFPSFVADPGVANYTKAETDTIIQNFEKVNHPDKHFQTQGEFDLFLNKWMIELNVKRNKTNRETNISDTLIIKK